MSDDDPFAGKKRLNKKTKRRPRPQRLSFVKERDSESDATSTPAQSVPKFERAKPLQRNGARMVLAARSSSQFPKRSIGLPRKLASYVKSDSESDPDDDTHRDYSAKGLQRLREQTASAPRGDIPRSSAEPPKSANAPSIIPLNEGVGHFIDRGRADVSLVDMAEDALDSDAKQIEPILPLPLAPELDAAGFIGLDRDRTEAQLGGTIDVDELMSGDPMLIDTEGAQSGADEWEKEQLRRAGLPVDKRESAAGVDGVSDRMARTIIDEEDLNLGVRGEVGLSVVSTCLEGIEEAVHTTHSHIEQCTSKLAGVRKATAGSDAALEQHTVAIETATAREEFYETLAGFADDVSDMLANRRTRIAALHERKKTRLMKQAEELKCELTSATDDFGRTIDVATVVHKYYNVDDDLEENCHDSNIGKNGDDDDVFADIERDFCSISRISDIFRDWRFRFSEDYDRAFGDKSVGKICGAVAMGSADSERLNWLRDVPKQARMYALEVSHACELLELHFASLWRPASRSSTRALCKSVREVCELTRGGGYAEKACERLFVAFLARLACDLQLLGRACADARADAKLAYNGMLCAVRHATLLFSRSFQAATGAQALESRFIGVVLREGVACVEKAAARTDAAEGVVLWVGFVEAVVLLASAMLSCKSDVWEPVRVQVRIALDGVGKGDASNKARACCRLIGLKIDDS